MNKHKKFIKDAYEGKYGTMCRDWKDTILEHYPEFGEKLEVGKWYRNTDYDDVIIMVCDPDGNKVKSYGFSNGGWFDHRNKKNYWGYMDDTDWRKATSKEVEEHLIEEAKKRGFVKGADVIPYQSYKSQTLQTSMYRYNQSIDTLNVLDVDGDLQFVSGYYACIYSDGKWAEIIPTMTKEEADEKLNCKIV